MNDTLYSSNVDTNIITHETTSTSIPESTSVIPLEANTEEDRTLNIHENLSDKDSNVSMGENPSTYAPISSSDLPPPSSPQPSLIAPPTIVPINCPTYENILQQPITTLFFS